jgi:hypothetical protein
MLRSKHLLGWDFAACNQKDFGGRLYRRLQVAFLIPRLYLGKMRLHSIAYQVIRCS